jgi:hyperosmotically inducible protein
MKKSFPLLQLTVLAFAAITAPVMLAARPIPLQNQSTSADNSVQNKDQGKTADNQSNAKSDRHITASVRKAIIADKDLSFYAHNIKIITINGTVTLKGPVKSEDERQKVLSDAAGVVGQSNIVDHMTVKQ